MLLLPMAPIGQLTLRFQRPLPSMVSLIEFMINYHPVLSHVFVKTQAQHLAHTGTLDAYVLCLNLLVLLVFVLLRLVKGTTFVQQPHWLRQFVLVLGFGNHIGWYQLLFPKVWLPLLPLLRSACVDTNDQSNYKLFFLNILRYCTLVFQALH